MIKFTTINRPFTVAASLSLAISVLCNSAVAQDSVSPGLAFEIGGGAAITPAYEGSNAYIVSPYPVISFGYLQLENGFSLGGGDGQGFSFRPSFGFIGARKAADYNQLTGLSDIDIAIELGGGFKYAVGSASIFMDARYGVVGHKGFVGELGADLSQKLGDKTTLSIGPRLSWATVNYMNTYFGVSDADSITSGLGQYTARGGIKSVGTQAKLRTDFTENWAIETGVGYNRLVGDAANSPITGLGSKNQFSGKIGLIRKIQIDF